MRATQAVDVFNRKSAPRPDEIAAIYSHLTPEEIEKIRDLKAGERRVTRKQERLDYIKEQSGQDEFDF